MPGQQATTGERRDNARKGSHIGRNAGTVHDSYYDTSTTNVSVSTGDDREVGTALSTDEMTGDSAAENMSALNWQFVWTTTDDYPVYQWERDEIDPMDQWQVPTPTATPTPTPTPVPTATPTQTSSGMVGDTLGFGPGFGPVVVVLALAALAAFAAARIEQTGRS